MRAPLRFICPECGKETYVEEEICNVTMWNAIEMFYDGTYETSFEDCDDYSVNQADFRYSCGGCGAPILEHTGSAHDARRKLYGYLSEQPYNRISTE